MLRAVIAGIGFTMLMLGAGRAADSDVHNQAQHRGARNELGLLMYCQDHGLAEQAAITAQKLRIDALPPTTPASLGEQEEADGRLGYLAFNGRQGLFTASASAQGLSLATACSGRALMALAKR